MTRWFDITTSALQNLWVGIVNFFPKLIGAIIVFLIGWLVSITIGKLVAEILKRLKFNQFFERSGWKNALEKADVKVDISTFLGSIVKWILLIVFLAASIEILGFEQLTGFLTLKVLPFLPNVIVAAFIFVVTVVIADILEKVIRVSIEGAKFGYGKLAGAIVKFSIWIFGIFTILLQLGIASDLVVTLIQGIVALIVIAGGIAFGLGGKDTAAQILTNLKDKLKGNKFES